MIINDLMKNGFELTICINYDYYCKGIILKIIKFSEFRLIREYDSFSS